MTNNEYTGRCFCGAVEVKVRGEPAAAGFCHCSSCREWSAAPVNAFTLWKTSDVEVVRGGDRLGTYHRTDRSLRQFCRECGGHVMTEHPEWGLIDVYAAVIPAFPFEPRVHVHYAETVMPIPDDLPKFRDVPAEMGGSGETLTD